MRKLFIILLCAWIGWGADAQTIQPTDTVNISKIRKEGMEHSSVMHFGYGITELSGPRLTWSPGYDRAADWAMNEFRKLGLVNIHKDYWEPLGKSWYTEKCYAAITAPYYQNIPATPKAWSGSTNGPAEAELMVVSANDSADFVSKHKGKIRGKILVFDLGFPPTAISFSENAERFTEDSLKKLSQETDAGDNVLFSLDTAKTNQTLAGLRMIFGKYFIADMLWTFCKQEGVVAILNYGRGSEGTYTGDGSYNFRKVPGHSEIASVTIASQDYDRIMRLLKEGVPVRMQVDVKNHIDPQPRKGYNIIAELPGTDPKLKNQVVMIGGHFDSWHPATGATDNGAGSIVMMEVMRILKELKTPLKRTVRIALWGGEEQGLFGSLAYVNSHVADFATLTPGEDYDNISVYYNLDNGSGKIRGIHLQDNDQLRGIFTSWLAPFSDLDASTVSIKNSGYTDNESFALVGIPAFQFIQDPLNYETRTHHTNADSYDQLSEDDLKQAAVVIASLVYLSANRDEKLPRKPKPKPYGNFDFSFF